MAAEARTGPASASGARGPQDLEAPNAARAPALDRTIPSPPERVVACSSVVTAHSYLAAGDTLVASAHQHLAGAASDAGAARRFVREQLTDLDAETLHCATLLTSELVSNAILHAGGAILVGVCRLPDQVLVTVADDNHLVVPKQRAAPDPEMLAESGRGFQIIAEMAEDFGWQTLGDGIGKVAWFTLRLTSVVAPRG